METENNKLLYLDETKQLLKEKINYLGGNLTLESTFRSYSDALDNIYKKYPKVSDTGIDINLVNTKQGKLTTELSPSEISQESTTGKNLLRFPYISTTGTYANVNITVNNDGSLLVNGTGNNTGYFNFSNSTDKQTLKAGTYTMSLQEAGIEMTVTAGTETLGYISKLNTEATFTINEDTNVVIYLAVRANTSYDLLVKPQIELGSSATSWEKPTNGSAPNPDYPFPIHTVSGENNIKIENKNLFDYNKATQVVNNVNFVINEDKSIIANGTASSQTYWKLGELYLPKDNTYYISGSPSDGSSSTYRITCYLHDENGTYLSAHSDTGTGISFSGNKGYRLDYYIYIANGVTVTNKVFKPMITQGSTATDYVPYQEQNYPINLSGKNLVADVETHNGTTPQGVINNNNNYLGFLNYIKVKPNTTYTVTFEHGKSTSGLFVSSKDENNTFINRVGYNNSRTFTTGNTTHYIFCYLYDETSFPTIGGYIQLEQGSTATDYELYYNLEYCKIGDYSDELIKTSGKNLWNSNVIQGGRLFLNGNYFNQNNYVSNETPIPVEAGKTYTLSASGYTSNNQAGFVFFNNGTFVSSLKQQSTTFTVPSGVNQVYCDLANGSVIIPTSFSNFQLEEGSSATEYEPYGTNEWYIKKNIGKVVLNGNETWYLSVEGTNTNLYYNQRTQMSSDILSNYFIRNENLYTEDIEGIRGLPNNNRIWIRINKTIASNVNNFKTWLSTHNTTVYYVLNTPEYINITENYPTLVAQFENLNNAKSYNEQTNISQTNNDLPFIINTKALKKND